MKYLKKIEKDFRFRIKLDVFACWYEGFNGEYRLKKKEKW